MNDGRYVSVPIVRSGRPVWDNLYRVGVVGGMSRVAPFGPGAFYPRVSHSLGTNGAAQGSSVTKTFITLALLGLIVSSPFWASWMFPRVTVESI